MKFFEIFKNERKFLLGLFILSLVLRLAYVLPLPLDKLSPDAYDWMNIGWNIATGQGFENTWRPPGYPLWLGMIFFLFGKSIMMARIFNCLLGAMTCIIICHTGKKIFSSTVGKIAGVLAAFYPYFIAYTGDLLCETFLTFIISIAVLFVLLTSEKPTWKNIIVTGILIGIAGLTKSTVLPFFFLACGWIWWQAKSFKTGFMVGVFSLMTILPWTLRNYFHYDKDYVMPVSTPWYSLYISCCDEALYAEMRGESDIPSTNDAPSTIPPKDWNYISSLPLPERDRICKEKSLGWIKSNPDKFFHLVYLRFLHFWRLYPMMAYKWQKYSAMVTSGIYIPLCFIGIILSMGKFKKTSLLITLFAIYTAVHLPFRTMIRYRVPIDPYVIIFAVYTIWVLSSYIGTHYRALSTAQQNRI